MKKELNYVHDMVVKVDSRVDDLYELMQEQIKINVSNTEILKEHQRRSLANEESLELLKRHIHMVQGVAAFLGVLALVATIYMAVKG